MGERATHLMRDSPPGRGQGEKRRERERGDGLSRPLEVEARGPVSSFLCPPPHQRPLTHARTPSPPSPTHTSRSTPSLDAPKLWMLARPRTKPASSALDGRPGVARGAPAEGGAAPGAVAAWSARGAGAGAAALGGGTSWADAAATRRRSRQAAAGRAIVFVFVLRSGSFVRVDGGASRSLSTLTPALPVSIFLFRGDLVQREGHVRKQRHTHTHTSHAHIDPMPDPANGGGGAVGDGGLASASPPVAAAADGPPPAASKPPRRSTPRPGLTARLLASWQATQRKRISGAGDCGRECRFFPRRRTVIQCPFSHHSPPLSLT